VFATGAWSPGLIDLEGQCESKCWVYAHVQLSPGEAERMRGAATIYNDKLVSARGRSAGADVVPLSQGWDLWPFAAIGSPPISSRPCLGPPQRSSHPASASATPLYLNTILHLDTHSAPDFPHCSFLASPNRVSPSRLSFSASVPLPR
jgi:hypothetical protein